MNRDMERAWVEVSLDALKHNIKEVRRITNKDAKILAVVKADGYGHGYLETAKTLLENGADGLAVAMIDEAIALRQHGISAPVLILGHTPKNLAEEIIRYDLTPTVFDLELPEALSEMAMKMDKRAKVHIKVDTGMNRVGFLYADDQRAYDETVMKIRFIDSLPNVCVEGIFTHLATADEKDKTYAELQFERFMSLNKRLLEVGVDIPVRHVCNSAGVIDLPHMHLDMVRPGIMLYGLYPSGEVSKDRIDLRPVMSIKAKVTEVKTIPEGAKVSYGGKWTAPYDATVATIPIGYADGYQRSLSFQTNVIIKNKNCEIVGRICMDQCMANVEENLSVQIGDIVTLMGSDGDHTISADQIAAMLGTINYEVVCIFGERLPRVYYENGNIVKVLNYLV